MLQGYRGLATEMATMTLQLVFHMINAGDPSVASLAAQSVVPFALCRGTEARAHTSQKVSEQGPLVGNLFQNIIAKPE